MAVKLKINDGAVASNVTDNMKPENREKFSINTRVVGVILTTIFLPSFIIVTAASVLIHPDTDHQIIAKSVLASEANASENLNQMLQRMDTQIDLAFVNWLIAKDIPEFHNLTREDYFSQVDAMTEQVRNDMAQMQANGYGGTNPNDPKTRCQRFCSAIIRLQFAYADEFREENLTSVQMKALYADPDNITLAGLLRTRRGSCVSMPLVYLVIDQRLGLPVYLVALGKHFFIRWDEPHFRMNIETTSISKIAWTPDDSVYLDIEGMKRDQLQGSDLRNLNNREVVGELFFTRMSYWHTKNGKYDTQSLRDLACARRLAPDDSMIERTYQTVFNHNGIKPEFLSVDVRPKE